MFGRASFLAFDRAVRAHEEHAAWEHREMARLLHEWFDRLNRTSFEGLLPTSFLRVDRARLSVYRQRGD